MDEIGFPSQRKKQTFFPLKRRHKDITGGRDLPPIVLCCHTDIMIPSLTV